MIVGHVTSARVLAEEVREFEKLAGHNATPQRRPARRSGWGERLISHNASKFRDSGLGLAAGKVAQVPYFCVRW